MPGSPPEQQEDCGYPWRRVHACTDKEEQHLRGVQRGPQPVREAVQLGDAEEMAHDRDQWQEDAASTMAVCSGRALSGRRAASRRARLCSTASRR